MRQSGLVDAETTAYLDAQLDTLIGADFITSNVTINPGYSSASGDAQNPFYAAYGFGISGTKVQNRDLVVQN